MQPAGKAKENFRNPIGIYRNPNNKAVLGCIDPAQSDAAVEGGFVLVKECDTIAEVVDALTPKTETTNTEAK